MKIKILAILIVFLLLLIPMTAFAQDGSPNPGPDFTNLKETLLWLTTFAMFASNWIFGKLLESFAFWKNVPRVLKYIIPPVVAVLLGFGAKYLLETYPGFVDAAQPWYELIATIVIGWFGSQVAHTMTKKKELGAG